MTTTRTTIAGLDGVPHPVAGLDLRARARTSPRDAALALLAAAILLLVAF
ncbi:MAG: hypothetical protein IPO09_17365 [Anaeromyxobacter sp.]|nr:hypothetical protein [Anaeromyxobacter sp.]MBL0276531.1 hypothetical protein [Anaeromyxobacter sp.]